MPELPEVETLCRQLSASLPDLSIVELELRLAKILKPDPGLSADSIVGARFESVERHGKFLEMKLDRDLALLFHLRLAGQLVHRKGDVNLAAGGHPVPPFDAPLPHKSTHLIFSLSDGSRLFMTDIRQFGFCQITTWASAAEYISARSMGPDAAGPGLTLEALTKGLARRKQTRLKPLLLDQTFVAGLGNIYVDEALWLGRLHPLREAGSLTVDEVTSLLHSIQTVMSIAIDEGVAHVVNGRADPDRDFPKAHGRLGQPCPRCGTPIVRERVAGRSSYYCPNCQKAPASDR